ncbi:uncharacterized protein LOC143020979 [Oratosquilla oratoria]|uniref:uncharacterized protein LOC143020979 n=1 Tax=Oratosquilla oratoria TaxID=337810 RepID=UPI003F758A91
MVNYCRVMGCHNRSDREKELQFYRLPKVIKNQGLEWEKLCEDRRHLWLASLQQNFDGKNLDNIRICSAHFISGKKAELYQRDSPDWVPSVNMLGSKAKPPVASPEILRFKRREDRIQKKKDYAAAESLLLLNKDKDTTDLTEDVMSSMIEELHNLRTENIELRVKVEARSQKYDVDEFKDKDEKVLYNTGFPTFQILWTVFVYLEPFLPVKKTMSKFQMLIMTMMRLRLNVSPVFLSREFAVSRSTVCRIFFDVVDVMYVRMKPLVFWPSRDTLAKTMPMEFRKHFGTKCVVIIDCFEVFIDRPTNLKARAETWSFFYIITQLNFLLALPPQGTVSYISKAWGGRASDKHIAENDDLLNHILPGDLLLADRDFDIQASVGSVMAEVKIPAFTRGKNQLVPVDLEMTRIVAHVRIHVEKVIGVVRQKYPILNGPLSVECLVCRDNETVTPIDKIGLICCACINLCDSVIDFN